MKKKKKKGIEKFFEEIIVENFPKMGKEIVNQVPSVLLQSWFSGAKFS